MTSYSGRTGPNFSQYLNNLNTIQPQYEQEIPSTDDIDFEQELAIFTNVNNGDFIDYDALRALPNNPPMDFDVNAERRRGNEKLGDIKYESLLSGEHGSFMPDFAVPLQPSPQQLSYQQPSNMMSPAGSASSPQTVSSKSGVKRKQDTAQSLEEQTRVAAEEDKRRRNTAASARFRVKKKQREQTLERTVKEVNDKNAVLQAKIDQLEMENKWLKNLITEKSGQQTEKDIADLYQTYRRESEERESKGSEHKDGVGTN